MNTHRVRCSSLVIKRSGHLDGSCVFLNVKVIRALVPHRAPHTGDVPEGQNQKPRPWWRSRWLLYSLISVRSMVQPRTLEVARPCWLRCGRTLRSFVQREISGQMLWCGTETIGFDSQWSIYLQMLMDHIFSFCNWKQTCFTYIKWSGCGFGKTSPESQGSVISVQIEEPQHGVFTNHRVSDGILTNNINN